jgi:hypothetical protein
MSAVSSFTWPGSRVLASWQPLLSRLRPDALWIQHLLLHRVEALVAVSHHGALDRLNRLLLEALRFSGEAEKLAPMIGLEVELLLPLLGALGRAGLTCKEGQTWVLTPQGRSILERGGEACTHQERRVFYFSEGRTPSLEMRFLPLRNPASEPWTGTAAGEFRVQTLAACIDQTPDWKAAHGFPLEVRGLVEDRSDWRRVVVDRVEQLTILAMLNTAEDRVLAFALQRSNWQWKSESPVLSLNGVWRALLPDLSTGVSMEEWRQAWRAWGQPRGLPLLELEASLLEPQGMTLRVAAPRPLVERLRSARSDALKGEAWLLAGDSERTRAVARIDLREMS